MKHLSIKAVLVLALLNVTFSFAQAKKPTIMVIPSDVWCNKNGYMTEENSLGETVKVPNYKKAMQENAELLAVIAKINGFMAYRDWETDRKSVV